MTKRLFWRVGGWISVVIALASLATAVSGQDQCDGGSVWHDHYRNGYRIRHRHCVESLERHYQDDPLRTQHFHSPGTPAQSSKESPLELKLRLRIVPGPADEGDVYRPVI